MPTTRIEYTFNTPRGLKRTVTIEGDDLPAYVMGDIPDGAIGYLRMIVTNKPEHVRRVEVPDESEAGR